MKDYRVDLFHFLKFLDLISVMTLNTPNEDKLEILIVIVISHYQCDQFQITNIN